MKFTRLEKQLIAASLFCTAEYWTDDRPGDVEFNGKYLGPSDSVAKKYLEPLYKKVQAAWHTDSLLLP